jgi:hypothetical protein
MGTTLWNQKQKVKPSDEAAADEYVEKDRLESKPGHRLPWRMVFVIFLNASTKIPVIYF